MDDHKLLFSYDVYFHHYLDTSNEIKEQLEATKGKLVEVELYLSSERGNVTLQLEEELATAKLRIAELEAEKDDMEIELRRKYNNRGVNNSIINSSSRKGDVVLLDSSNDNYNKENSKSLTSYGNHGIVGFKSSGNGKGKDNHRSPTRQPMRASNSNGGDNHNS